MSDDLDEILDAQLSAMVPTAVPGHEPGFWDVVNERLERAGAERAGAAGAGAAGESGPAPDETSAGERTIRSLTLPPAQYTGPQRTSRDPHGFLPQARRWVPLAVAAGLVGIALATSALTGLGPDDAPPADPSPSLSQGTSTTPSPSESPSTTQPDETSPADRVNGKGSATVTDLERIDATIALHGFGPDGPLQVPGTPSLAWTWRDRGGERLLVLSAQRTHDDQAPELAQDDATLYATVFRSFVDDDGVSAVETERRMQDPGAEPCSIGEPDDFLETATALSDTDGDGIGEVTIGWHYACRGDIGQDNIKLAVLEGGDKYILRGTGYRLEDARVEYGGAAMTRVPEPAMATWPQGLYAHAVAVWDTIAW